MFGKLFRFTEHFRAEAYVRCNLGFQRRARWSQFYIITASLSLFQTEAEIYSFKRRKQTHRKLVSFSSDVSEKMGCLEPPQTICTFHKSKTPDRKPNSKLKEYWSQTEKNDKRRVLIPTKAGLFILTQTPPTPPFITVNEQVLALCFSQMNVTKLKMWLNLHSNHQKYGFHWLDYKNCIQRKSQLYNPKISYC